MTEALAPISGAPESDAALDPRALFDAGLAGIALHDLVPAREHLGAQLLFALQRCELVDLVARDQEQKGVAQRQSMRLDLIDRVLVARHRL